MGTNSKLHVQFTRRHWNDLGCNGDTCRRHRLPEHVGGARTQPGTAGILVDYTGGNVGASFGSRNPVQPRAAVPLPDRAGASRPLAALEREGDDRLLARVPVDARLVLVLEGRPVHARSPGSRAGRRATATSAGEHTSIDFQGYLNGAVETGERAAGEVIADLG